MADPVGLSIGTTNLVAVRVGSQPVTCRAVLTLSGRRPPEVGLPAANSDGLVLRGFVERVGDPVPLVAVDGSSYLADRLVVEALGAMRDTVGDSPDVVIAVPVHWGAGAVRALSDALARDRKLAPTGVTPRLVPDAAAALVALRDEPGLTGDGIDALVDFGGSGTSITLVDAANGVRAIADTVRYPQFSGDLVDQAILAFVLAAVTGETGIDPGATAAVASLARLRDECRRAKERLSTEAATAIRVELPGVNSEIPLTRVELEGLIEKDVDGAIDALQNLLQRNGRSWSDISAVAAVGGGASIPFVAQRFSDRSQSRLVATARPGEEMAIGAALIAARGPDADAPTGIGTAVADAATTGFDGVRAVGAQRGALAWSQDDDRVSDPVPFTDHNPYAANPYASSRAGARPRIEYIAPTGPIMTPAPRARRLPQIAIGVAAVIAVVAAGGVVYSLSTAERATTTPTVTTTPSLPAAEAPPPLPETTAVPPPATQAPAPPPPPVRETVTETITPTTTHPPTATPTTTAPTTTAPTTTTTAPTTTTTTTTTTSPTTTTTTTAPPTTTSSPTAPTPAMTTTYLNLPFVPLPIPIQVPQPPSPHLPQAP